MTCYHWTAFVLKVLVLCEIWWRSFCHWYTTNRCKSSTEWESIDHGKVSISFFVNVWILGAILEVPISQLCFPVCDFQEDRKRITWCSHPDPFTCVINSPEKKSKFKGMKSFIAYNIIPSVSMCSPKVVLCILIKDMPLSVVHCTTSTQYILSFVNAVRKNTCKQGAIVH